jgi:hypothetical protein
MNIELTYQLVKHIFACLNVVKADFVNQKMCNSIMDKQYLLPEDIHFDVDGQTQHNKIYGCQMVFGGKEFRMLLADCTTDKQTPEYCLLTHLQDAPMYAIHYTENDKEEAFVAVNTNNIWMPCPLVMQFTFAAGMEQIKDIAFGWTKCSKYSDHHKQLLSFVDFVSNYCGEDEE